jgi:hypothetical protein
VSLLLCGYRTITVLFENPAGVLCELAVVWFTRPKLYILNPAGVLCELAVVWLQDQNCTS